MIAYTVSDVVHRCRTTSESDVAAMSDSISKGAGKFAQVSLVPSDVVGRVFTGARSISDNSVSVISDSLTKVFHGFRSTSESLVSALSDSISKGAGKFPQVSLVPSDV